jgi:hypothetical protein
MGRYHIILVCKMPDGKLILVRLGSVSERIEPNFQALLAAVRGYKLDSIAAVHPGPGFCWRSESCAALDRKRPDARVDPKMVC